MKKPTKHKKNAKTQQSVERAFKAADSYKKQRKRQRARKVGLKQQQPTGVHIVELRLGGGIGFLVRLPCPMVLADDLTDVEEERIAAVVDRAIARRSAVALKKPRS